MTENEVLGMLLGIKEIQVDRFEVQDRHLHIYCSSIFQEALCPHCLKKDGLLTKPISGNFAIYLLPEKRCICI